MESCVYHHLRRPGIAVHPQPFLNLLHTVLYYHYYYTLRNGVMSALLPKLFLVAQSTAQCRSCSTAAFAARRYVFSESLSDSISSRFKNGRWPMKEKCNQLPLSRSISAHKKSTIMLLSTGDSKKNRFEKVNTV